jgi:hypothetical protein
MTTTGRMKSSPLTHTIRAITTWRKTVRGENGRRAFDLRFWNDESNIKN